MYEDLGLVTEKLAACIYAALRFPENNPAVVAAWDENHQIVSALIQTSFCKHEKTVVERTIRLQPEEQEHLKNVLEQERLDMQRQRELGEKQRKWEAARRTSRRKAED